MKFLHKSKRVFLVGMLAGSMLAIIAFGYYEFTKSDHEKFAECLTRKGTVMYGADWCDYCQNQKKMFGEAFSKINYINCDFHQAECKEKDVRKYPTWYINGEKQMPGVLNFGELASKTGCKPPKSQQSNPENDTGQ